MKIKLSTLLALTLVLSACGKSDSDKKEEQANGFFATYLNTPAEITCNKDMNYFDLSSKECAADVRIASFPCTRQGLVEKTTFTANGGDLLSSFNQPRFTLLDEKINEGFAIYSCGESVDTPDVGMVYVQLVKKTVKDDEAGIEIQPITFVKQGKAPSTTTPAP